MAVAQKIRAKHYLECSAKTGEGVREVFQYAIRATISTRGQAVRGNPYSPNDSPPPSPAISSLWVDPDGLSEPATSNPSSPHDSPSPSPATRWTRRPLLWVDLDGLSEPSTSDPSSTHDSPFPSPSTMDAFSSQQQREEEKQRKEEARLREVEVTRKEEDARRKAEAARQREKEKEMIRQAEEVKRQQEEVRRREEELKAKEHESKRKEAEILRRELELWEREDEIRRKEEAARRVEMAQIVKMAEERRREEQELGEREENRRREEAVQREAGAEMKRKEREEGLQSKENERRWKAEEAERKKEEEPQRKQKGEDAGQGLTPSVRLPGARTIKDPIVLKSVDTRSLAPSEFTYAKSISSTQTVTITSSNHHLRAYYRHKGQWDRLHTEKYLTWDTFPWPVLKQPTKVEEIIADDVEEYLHSLYQLPQNIFGSMEEYVADHIDRWDYDRMDAKVFSRVHIQQRRKVEEGVIRVGGILRAVLRSVQESR
jgi:TolA protein